MATALLVITDETQIEDADIDGREQRLMANQRVDGLSRGDAEPLENLRLDYLVRKKAKVVSTNAFSPSTWYRAPPRQKPPPPPAPPAPYAAPAPTAPPLPFKYFGSYEDGPKHIVLLLKDGQIHPVMKGDTIDGIYRMQKIAGSEIEIIYLPLDVTQRIQTGIKAFVAK